MQKRLADVLDKHLQRTQYGFRRHRGTAQALHDARRIMENKGEKTQTKTLLVLLDGEKAFDEVRHDKLFEALERMNVPDQYMAAIKQIYDKPAFNVEMDGYESTWIVQETGIRQGCPLSPYLFLVVMTCLFHDIHDLDHLKLSDHRIIGMQEDEVLYADDTICMTENENAMNRRIRAIEIEEAKYGLRLNKNKCEYLHCGARPVYFHDGTKVPNKTRSQISRMQSQRQR